MVEVSLSNVQLDAIYFCCMLFIETKYLCSPPSQFCGHPEENWGEWSLVCSREKCLSSKLQFLKKMFINSVSVLFCFTWLFCPGACLILLKSA